MKHVLKTVVLVMLLAVMMTGVAAAETNLLTITSQPANKSVAAGSTAQFTVEATTSASSISYQWQFRKDANSSWAPSAQSGNKTATLSVSATNGLNGYQFRCVVKDSQGSVVNSDAATLYIIPKITTQPVGKTVAPGTTAKFTVAATGTGTLTYQWQYRKDANSAWAASAQSGNKTATLSVAATNGLHGYQFRCKVTHGNGQTAYTNAATLSVSPRITVKPTDRSVPAGTTAEFSVTAAGTGTLTYQWQFRKNADCAWAASAQSGNKSVTLSVAARDSLNGYQFRCVIKDGSNRTAYTSAVTLHIIPKITTQPVSKTAAPGTKATFTVAATGTGTITYQWQFRQNADSAWAASGQSGNKTATLSVNVTNGLHGYQFRCVVTHGNGKKAYSNIVTLSVSPRISTQPADNCASLGTKAEFSVTAAGTGTLKYQWEYQTPTGTTWASSAQSGNKTAKLSVSTAGNLQGYRFRCKITDGSGNVAYTRAATLTLCDIPVDETYFPDATFRQYVSRQFDTSWNDGKLDKTEIQNAVKIYLYNKGISDLKGVEFFTALTTLECRTNNLTKLDVSRNTALTYLDCCSTKLTKLDVSRNTALTYLDCGYNNLTSLDLSRNTALTYLDCGYNNLTSLDLSRNTALKHLECDKNKLTALDVSKNTALQCLYCNDNNLTALNVSKNSALETLRCGYNNLTALDVSKNTALQQLECYNNQLTALDVSKNTELKKLACSSNENLTSLDVSKNTALEALDCSYSNLTALDVSKNTALESLSCSNAQLSSLDVSKNTALTSLNCADNKLSVLNVSKNTNLITLNCKHTNLTALDVSKNTALKYLYCNNNTLTALDLSKNTALEYLRCDGNKLTSIDVSKSTALKELDCGDNLLTTLDVSNNTALTYLFCSRNKLTSLNVAKNTSLNYLYCFGNDLSSLTLSPNTALEYLWCSNNKKLSSLDLSKNTALRNLECYGCNLSSLDLSKNTAMTTLYCNNNVLSTLNVSNCTALKNLYCYSNKLTTLDVSKSTELKKLSCYANNLTELNVSNNTALSQIDCDEGVAVTGAGDISIKYHRYNPRE